MTRTSRLTPTTQIGTQSDEDGFEGPQDIGDLVSFDGGIGDRGSSPRQPTGGNVPRRPPMGGIDLGKGPDLGKGLDLEKPRAPRSGIGLEIGKSPANNLGIGAEVPLPVPAPVSARGGVSIDPVTGQIRGGYGGLGIGKGAIGTSVDVGVDTPAGSTQTGCFKYVTFSIGPFSHTFGKNECEPKTPSSQSTPTPSPTPAPAHPPSPPSPPTTSFPVGACVYYNRRNYGKSFSDYQLHGSFDYPTATPSEENSFSGLMKVTETQRWVNNTVQQPSVIYYTGSNTNTNATRVYGDPVTLEATSWVNQKAITYYLGAYAPSQYSTNYGVFTEYYYVKINGAWEWRSTWTNEINECKCPGAQTQLPPPSIIPIPNPPPRKMNEDCCKQLLILQLETLRLLGRQIVNGKLEPISKTLGFLGEEVERTKTPIEDPVKPEKIKIKFDTIYELLMYILKQANNLDTALDPQSYKIPTGYVQNPAYDRDSEQSLLSNNQPEKDKFGNKRELEINKDDEIKISGFLQQQAYVFQALRRIEYLFPFGELNDALIAKSLLIPGAEGEIKIHNMIQAYELQMQYLDAALGNPREILTIKDANPAIKGDQPIEVRPLSISDLLRQNIKFHIDTGGDVNALVNLVLRDFRTNLANRIDLVKNNEMTQALFEDSGMRESQEYIPLHLEGDPYAGQWAKGEGFKSNPELEKKTEEATEKVLQETMNPTDIKVKVSRRHKDEKTDIRDLLRGLADFIQRLLSIPSGGDAAKSLDKLVESAKFKVQTEMALIRQNVSQAATASRNRTKKRKK